jgi:hypothetical protein
MTIRQQATKVVTTKALTNTKKQNVDVASHIAPPINHFQLLEDLILYNTEFSVSPSISKCFYLFHIIRCNA